ncbi:hypothetical protein OBBRIDRAFT_425713 [Obba rivulosa]|uniref:Uncharacterized protein n=1 Tax=Obba rivulosa TaxID=1052685 RepID=A0A8E2ALK3_9APHY|nr:hypothetical protein OBBRIDRAFT_425713 [Obba rivulosa]
MDNNNLASVFWLGMALEHLRNSCSALSASRPSAPPGSPRRISFGFGWHPRFRPVDQRQLQGVCDRTTAALVILQEAAVNMCGYGLHFVTELVCDFSFQQVSRSPLDLLEVARLAGREVHPEWHRLGDHCQPLLRLLCALV